MDIYEQEDTNLVLVETKTVPKDHSYYINVVQPLIDDLTYTLIPYAASALELQDAITAKQAEIRQHFEGLHGESLASVKKRQAAPQPSVVTTVNTVTNMGVADGAISTVGAMIDKATVDAYDVSGAGWV